MYKQFRNIAVISLALLLVSGCLRVSLEVLRDVKPKGNKFQTALMKEYLAFSEKEAAQYDWVDSEHFARKGLMLARGKDVEPEMVESWDIPETLAPTLADARKKLMEIITNEVKRAQPETAAKAIFYFDCWMEEQEENWQTEHIDACRNNFYGTLDVLSVVAGSVEPAKKLPASMQKKHTDKKETSKVVPSRPVETKMMEKPKSMESKKAVAKKPEPIASAVTMPATPSAEAQIGPKPQPQLTEQKPLSKEVVSDDDILRFEMVTSKQKEEKKVERVKPETKPEAKSEAKGKEAAANAPASMPKKEKTSIAAPLPKSMEKKAVVAAPLKPTKITQKKEADASYALFFSPGSSAITGEANGTIQEVIEEVKNHKEYQVVVHGYANHSGNKVYNLALARKRANNVKNAFVKQGLTSESVELRAYSEAMPEEMMVGEAKKGVYLVDVFIH